MNIIIVGAGEVGFQIAERLVAEKHDVVIVDQDPDKILDINKSLDVLTVVGHGGDYNSLNKAGLRSCNILIAVTDVDETNMIACFIARKFNVPLKIARIRSYIFQSNGFITKEELGIDVLINPEEVATDDIVKLIETPAAFETVNFSEEELIINGYKISESLEIAGFQLKDLIKFKELEKILFLAIIREFDMIIPTGNDYLLPNDKVYVIGKSKDFENVDPYFSESEEVFNYVFVVGVTKISRFLCTSLENMGIRVKVIEPDRKECLAFAEDYHNIEVVNCNPTDLGALQDEGISNVDVFIALSNDEEDNILSCMIAKKQKVKKTIAKIQKKEYLDFTSVIGIDAVINPKISTVGEILRYVRGGNILSVDTLGEKDAEAIEYLITKDNKLIKTPIKELEFPNGCLIAAIISGHKVIIPRGDDFFDVDDKVIVFTAPNLTTDIGDLFI